MRKYYSYLLSLLMLSSISNLAISQINVDIEKETFNDIMIPVKYATIERGEFQEERGIENTIDGNFESGYHSRWRGETQFPVEFSFHFDKKKGKKIDYAIIHGTTSHNGKIKEMNVYAKQYGGKEFKVGGTRNLKGVGGKQFIDLNLKKVEYIRYEVLSGTGSENGYVSISEMEFFQQNPNSAAEFSLFTDASCSQLKPGVKPKQIKKIKSPLLRSIAEQLYDGNYDSKYRIATYSPVPSPDIIAEELKIGNGFSRYENITGMFLKEGKNIVLVGNTYGNEISLRLPNLMRKPKGEREGDWSLHDKVIELREGINIIDLEYDANAYIDYFVDKDHISAKDIAIHFPTGEVNGYFDATTQTDEEWNSLLDNAVSPIMDMKGKYIQVAYPVEFFKQFTYNRGIELIENYDKMLLRQYKFMGLEKYNRLPKNRIFARVNFHYYMFRDGNGVAYMGNESTMNMVANPSVVVKGDPCWGFSHEVGHVLQVRPQLNWGGLTEVSNNLYSLYTTIGLGNTSRLKNGKSYDKAREVLMDKGISYLQVDDVFVRLVPFWQLHLYFSENGHPDFYADLMEEMRNRPHVGLGNESIRNQFEFIKLACEVGKVDLTEFFEKWGFFYVGDIELEDYGKYSYTITQKQVDETKDYIAKLGLEKPKVDITTLEDK